MSGVSTWKASFQMSLGSLALDVSIDGGLTPVALIGPNGSGKTTLLRLFVGALPAQQGYFSLGERCLFSSENEVNLSAGERNIGYVPQGYGLFPHLNVKDNVAFGLATRWHQKLQKLNKSEASYRALALLEELGCSHLVERMPPSLSGGEQQRVALARALLVRPQLLLLDEPLAALDATGRKKMRRFLATHLDIWKTPALVVTHDVRDVLALKAQVIVLEQGRVIQSGTPQELAANPASDFVEEFFDRVDLEN